MQMYHAASCTSAVNNSAIGGPSARETGRADTSSLPTNFSPNPRLMQSRQKPLDREFSVNFRSQLADFLPDWQEAAMSTLASQKKERPQIIKLDKALKLAEQWVNNMTKAAEDEQTSAESESRPARLGLGAKVSHQFQFRPSNDPLERKLLAKLDSGKRKAAKSMEESTPSDDRGCNDNSDEDEDFETKSSIFAKKRAFPLTSYLPPKKKHK